MKRGYNFLKDPQTKDWRAAMTHSLKINNSIVKLTKGDITDLEIEAFVFYAESDLKLSSGFGNAIATRGGPIVAKELEELGALSESEATVSGSGNMKSTYIVHANGPKFQEPDTPHKLKKTILNALAAAENRGIKRIAFPGMGTGFYGIPKPLAARVMHEAFEEYLAVNNQIEELVVCLMENREFAAFSTEFNV